MSEASVAESRSYRLDPRAFRALFLRRCARATVRLGLFVLTIAQIVQLLPWALPVLFWASLAPCLVIPIGFCCLVIWGKLRPEYDSYELTLEPELLRCSTASQPATEIARSEVAGIVEVPGWGLTVRSTEPRRAIFIPEQAVDFAQLRERLRGWCAFERRAARPWWI